MNKKIICGVYKITNIINDKYYIGSSNNIYHRWYEHKRDLNNNKHCNMHLQRAWDKYGQDNFEFEIIEKTEEENQFKREQFWIDNSDCYKREIGYNISKNALGGGKFGEDNSFYGKSHSTKSKELISGNRIYRTKDGVSSIKLNGEIVEKVRLDLLNLNLSYKELADKYHIDSRAVCRIKTYSSWSEIRPELKELIFLKRTKIKEPTRQKLRNKLNVPTELQEKIIKLYKEGYIPIDIINLGYNNRTVYRTIEQYCGYTPKKQIEKDILVERNNKIKELYSKGLTNRQIEIELDLSRRVVQKEVSKIKKEEL